MAAPNHSIEEIPESEKTAQFRRRLLAILDYDRIPKGSRVTHVAKSCGISRSSARRFLGNGNFARSRLIVHLAIGLNVCARWLYEGKFAQFDPRTSRINLQEILGYPKEDADRIIYLMIGYVAGHQKCTNLTRLVLNGSLSALQAARMA